MKSVSFRLLCHVVFHLRLIHRMHIVKFLCVFFLLFPFFSSSSFIFSFYCFECNSVFIYSFFKPKNSLNATSTLFRILIIIQLNTQKIRIDENSNWVVKPFKIVSYHICRSSFRRFVFIR